MQITTRKTRTSPAFTFALLLLGAAVFAWGTQSKLSLYQRPSPFHPLSIAKLLSDNQANKKGCLPRPSERKVASDLSLLAAVVLISKAAATPRSRQASTVVVPAIPSRTYALFFRPPPTIA